jgi:predicted nucleotidyltransferase
VKNIGIICEYNPFHNGHAYQLGTVGALGRAVCLMSGDFVQRGEPAILDKYTRAKAAVLCGADLVLELPLIYSVASAEAFAQGGVGIFNALGVMEGLCFGSEWGQVKELMDCARILLSEELREPLKEGLHKGLSFPKARQVAAEALGAMPGLLEQPNNILALEYCKALLQSNSAMEPMVLKRRGAYHGGRDQEAPSASFLRSVEDWSGFVPEKALEVFAQAPRHCIEAGERAWLSRLRFMCDSDFEALPYGSEGLWRKVMSACRSCASLQEIMDQAISKRYPRTRLQRMLLCAFLGITEEMLGLPVPYVRVLAMSLRGQELMRQLRKTSGIPLLHPGEEAPRSAYSELERRAEDLYGLFRLESPRSAGQWRKARLFRYAGQ